MTRFLRTILLCGLAIGASLPALAEDKPTPIGPKLQPYIGCINRLSERSYSSRARYLSWSKPSGPTGRERIIYGLYTIYDTADCRKNVEKAAEMAPKNEELEKAGAAFAAAVGALEPMLKEADDYYSQQNYKDDKMAKGKAMHPKLMAVWAAFASADQELRGVVQKLNDVSQAEEMAEVEKREGRKARWHVMDTMLKAKALNRIEGGDPAKMDLAKVQEAIGVYEASVKALETYAEEHKGGALNPDSIGSIYVSAAKSYLTSAKGLMRRVRDKVPYSSGERMMLSQQGAGWMIEGSPPRLMRDYNELVNRFNSGGRF
ncbi:MAG: YiiG family protein [Hyphomicrobiales bacterium]|nr:YiiG family protein [Rhodoblastus sp.]MCC2104801.1 YiiG family protein [Hyphomicrobiales bacterium]MCC2106838.1 YiiG family protein [Hyphomicrobiales bacterium]